MKRNGRRTPGIAGIVLLTTAGAAGLQLISAGDFSPDTLIHDEARSSYRGRYCTTFILFACKLP